MAWIDYCPLRSEDSPEYRLLLATIREEIGAALNKSSSAKRGLFYTRVNTILILATIIATAIKWH